MFNNLREKRQNDSTSFDRTPARDEGPPPGRPGVGFLGMTSGQRLAVAILLLIAVCVLGTTCLLATGAIRTF